MPKLTAGQRALIEAARLESARVYGGVVPGKRTERPLLADRAEAFLSEMPTQRDAPEPARPVKKRAVAEPDPAVVAVLAGDSVHEVMAQFGLTYAEVRAIRKQTMSGGAA